MTPVPLTPSLRRLVLAWDRAGLTDGEMLGEYVRTADPAAFEGLVRRHGAMVLGVCRRVVGDRHTAEDAFQAVWIVLARRAGTVRPRDLVGNWLFGVAYRTALKARGRLARRRAREKQVSSMPHPEAPPTAAAWADITPLIDAELARLTDDLRVPVVLCDLEGRTQRDAARHLKLPVTTLVNRLAKARRTLARRLADRGVTLSGGALAGVLSTHASANAVPHALAAAAVAGATTGAASTAAIHLSEGVLRMLMLAKLKPVSLTALALAVVSLGIGTAVLPTAAGQDPARQPLAKAGRLDDDAFLRRACSTIRGTPATDLERALFGLDADPKKRAKVVEWLLADTAVAETKSGPDGTASKALIGWLTRPNGSGWNVEPSHVEKGINWLTTYQGSTTDCKTCHAVPTIEHFRGRMNLNGFSHAVGGPATPLPGEKNGTADASTDDATRWTAEVAFDDPAKQAADKSRVELDSARVEAAESQIRYRQAEAARKRAAGGAKIDADLAAIDAEVARVQYEKAKVRLDQLLKARAAADSHVQSARDSTIPLWHHAAGEGDAAFLQRALQDGLGKPPTALELKYFTGDKDPKKREKILDLLLKDPTVAKKVGPGWKDSILGRFKVEAVYGTVNNLVELARLKVEYPDPHARLLDQVMDGKRSDEQIADAICLATVGRFPTETEQTMARAVVAGAKDKRAAWSQVAAALAGTKEARSHADALRRK